MDAQCPAAALSSAGCPAGDTKVPPVTPSSGDGHSSGTKEPSESPPSGVVLEYIPVNRQPLETVVGIIVLIIVLAIVFGALGLLLEGLKWLLIIGVILLVAGAVMGFLKRGSVSR